MSWRGLFSVIALFSCLSEFCSCVAQLSSSASTVPITVAIRYDRYPDETSWILQCDDVVYADERSSDHGSDFMEALVFGTYQIVQGSTCNFTIWDDYGDGICCYSGMGWYQLLLGEIANITSLQQHEDVLTEGGSFGSRKEFIFVAEQLTPTSSPAPSDHASSFPSISPTLTSSPSTSPSDNPSIAPSESHSPSLTPSFVPSSSPSSSVAPTPTTFPVTIVIQLDRFPQDTGWSLECGDHFYAQLDAPVYSGRAYELIQESFQVVEGTECVFTIADDFGDGIAPEGFFQVFWGEDSLSQSMHLLFQGGEFEFQDQFAFEAIPLVPTASPAPSFSPSVVPSIPPSTSAGPSAFSDCQISDPSQFNICLDSLVSGSYTTDWTVYLNDAKSRWESIVTEDTSLGVKASQLVDINVPICNGLPAVVDDLYICARDVDYDGPGGILGQAVVSARNGDSEHGLPVAGYMLFDSSDIESLLNSGAFAALILHEMGHLMGLGPLWRSRGLISNTGSYNNPNWVYVGSNACLQWQNITHCGGCPPVENFGFPGAEPGHWDEEGMEHELMTGFVEPDGVHNALSRITIGSLEDLGYKVDYNQADEYSFENLACPTAGNLRHLENHIGSKKPQLSPEGTQAARHYGSKLLAEGRERRKQASPSGSELIYTADQHVSIMYQEENYIYFVDVHA